MVDLWYNFSEKQLGSWYNHSWHQTLTHRLVSVFSNTVYYTEIFFYREGRDPPNNSVQAVVWWVLNFGRCVLFFVNQIFVVFLSDQKRMKWATWSWSLVTSGTHTAPFQPFYRLGWPYPETAWKRVSCPFSSYLVNQLTKWLWLLLLSELYIVCFLLPVFIYLFICMPFVCSASLILTILIKKCWSRNGQVFVSDWPISLSKCIIICGLMEIDRLINWELLVKTMGNSSPIGYYQ